MSQTPLIGDLDNIEMLSGVSETTGEAFVSVRAVGQARDVDVVLIGQLSPREMRAHALAYLEAAEAAESDACVFVELTEGMGGEPAMAGAFLAALRQRREEQS
jgi:hypothetical protein